MLTALDRRSYNVGPMPLTKPTSGARIHALRQRRGLSLRQAARVTGLSHGTIRNLEERIGRWDGVQVATLQALARGYGVGLASINRIAEDREPLDGEPLGDVGEIEAYRVHPDWIVFPVFGSVSAGDAVPEPLTGEIAYIPREHLQRRGAAEETVRVYVINGSCMVSDEARRVEKNFAPGDYIAVDFSKGYEIGDPVVAWWPDENVMVIKRYKVEGENIVLYPLSSSRPQMVLPDEDSVNILGPVVWRGG